MGSIRLRLPRSLFTVMVFGLFFSAGCFAPVQNDPPATQGLDDGSAAILPIDGDFEPDLEVVEEPVVNPVRPVDEPIELVEEPPRADLNDDGVFDQNDENAFRDQFGSTATDNGFDPSADFDGDGEITLVDFQMFLEFASDTRGDE